MRDNADDPQNKENYQMKNCERHCEDIILTKQRDCNYLKVVEDKLLGFFTTGKRFECETLRNEKKCDGNVRNCNVLNWNKLEICLSKVGVEVKITIEMHIGNFYKILEFLLLTV